MSIMTRNDSPIVRDSEWELQESPVGPVLLTGIGCASLTATQLPVALGNGAGQPECGGMLVSPDSIMAVPTTTETEISSIVCDSEWELQGSPVGPVPPTGDGCAICLSASQLPVALGSRMLVAPRAVGLLVSPDSNMAVPTESEISSMVCDSKWPVATDGERFAGGTCNAMEAVCDPRKCMESEGNASKFGKIKGGNAGKFFPEAFSSFLETGADEAVRIVGNTAEAVCDPPSGVESEGNSTKFCDGWARQISSLADRFIKSTLASLGMLSHVTRAYQVVRGHNTLWSDHNLLSS